MDTKLNKKQRDLVNQLQEFTGCRNKKLWATILKDVKWSVEQGCEVFFTNYADSAEANIDDSGSSGAKKPKPKSSDKSEVIELFDKYAKGEIDISEEGVGEFFEDLGVDSMDPVTLVISYYMDAKNMGEYTKTEFKTGFEAMGVSSIAELKSQAGTLRKELKNENEFLKIYKFVFNFLKGEAARNVNIEFAIAMWDLLLKERFGSKVEPFLEKWKEFLVNQKDNNGLNGIKKDEWFSLMDLIKEKGLNLADMRPSDVDCWPILFDSFFEFIGTA